MVSCARSISLGLLIAAVGCSAPRVQSHRVPASASPPEPEDSSLPFTPRHLDELRQSIGVRGQDLNRLLSSLGFASADLAYEELCGEGPLTLYGPLSDVAAIAGNLDTDPDDEWVATLTVHLAPRTGPPAPKDRTQAVRLLLVFDRDGEEFRVRGRSILGSALTRRFEVFLRPIHDAHVHDIVVVEDFDACLADPREVWMRDYSVLTIARGRLELLWEKPGSRQGPWVIGDEQAPEPPSFSEDFPRTITCPSCNFQQRRFRFDHAAYRYVEADESNP